MINTDSPLVRHLMGGLLELTYTPAFLSWDLVEEYYNPDMFHINILCQTYVENCMG